MIELTTKKRFLFTLEGDSLTTMPGQRHNY